MESIEAGDRGLSTIVGARGFEAWEVSALEFLGRPHLLF